MKKTTNLALFGHGVCGSKFFAESGEEISLKYIGKCPNPSCDMRVALLPEEIFRSTDKARREYIRRSQKEHGFIFWQT
jgi:hypothetical protein